MSLCSTYITKRLTKINGKSVKVSKVCQTTIIFPGRTLKNYNVGIYLRNKLKTKFQGEKLDFSCNLFTI